MVWGIWTGTQSLPGILSDPSFRLFIIGALIVTVILLRPGGILIEQRHVARRGPPSKCWLARDGECENGPTRLIRGDVPAPNNMRRERILSAPAQSLENLVSARAGFYCPKSTGTWRSETISPPSIFHTSMWPEMTSPFSSKSTEPAAPS